jgi:gliding motility-associated-like protein
VQATNTNQCVSVTRTPVKVTVTTITADAGRDTSIIADQSIALRATGGTTYVWSPATGLNNPNVASPIATPAKTTTYQVTVTTEDGCTATDEVTITVIPRVQPVNTFSPNGDNINETWEIKNIENYPNATVEVFNRWGNQVFKSEDGYRQPWDGTHKGSALPLATYYYIIRLDRDIKPISGSITIIR